MKKLLLLFTLPFSFLLATAHAMTFQHEPQVCPKANAIKTIGVSHNVVQNSTGLWFTGRRNQHYDTIHHWTFLIGNIPAISVDHAYQKASHAMETLSFQLGPIQGPLGKWLCLYTTAQGYEAVTIFPAIANNNASLFLNR